MAIFFNKLIVAHVQPNSKCFCFRWVSKKSVCFNKFMGSRFAFNHRKYSVSMLVQQQAPHHWCARLLFIYYYRHKFSCIRFVNMYLYIWHGILLCNTQIKAISFSGWYLEININPNIFSEFVYVRCEVFITTYIFIILRIVITEKEDIKPKWNGMY